MSEKAHTCAVLDHIWQTTTSDTYRVCCRCKLAQMLYRDHWVNADQWVKPHEETPVARTQQKDTPEQASLF